MYLLFCLFAVIIIPITSSFLFLSSQVETFAQFGVVFLLFALGLEFSLTKVNHSVKVYYNYWQHVPSFLIQYFIIDAVKSSRACRCSWRATTNCDIYDLVWHNGYSMLLSLWFGFLLKLLFVMFLVKLTLNLDYLLMLQLCGAKLSEGVFVGSFLSMSSTAVVFFYTICLIIEFSFHLGFR